MKHYQAGVTLIELMVALTLLFIISAVGIPMYRGYVETAQQQALMARVEAFRMFQDNWRVDNGTYVAGFYESGGTNDFAAIGYRVADDDDNITLLVEACDGGSIDVCYKITGTNARGQTLVWQNGVYTWP